MNDIAKLREQSYEIFLSFHKSIGYLANMNIFLSISVVSSFILITFLYGKYNELSEKVDQNILNQEQVIEGECFE
jgi:hypothetical protein